MGSGLGDALTGALAAIAQRQQLAKINPVVNQEVNTIQAPHAGLANPQDYSQQQLHDMAAGGAMPYQGQTPYTAGVAGVPDFIRLKQLEKSLSPEAFDPNGDLVNAANKVKLQREISGDLTPAQQAAAAKADATQSETTRHHQEMEKLYGQKPANASDANQLKAQATQQVQAAKQVQGAIPKVTSMFGTQGKNMTIDDADNALDTFKPSITPHVGGLNLGPLGTYGGKDQPNPNLLTSDKFPALQLTPEQLQAARAKVAAIKSYAQTNHLDPRTGLPSPDAVAQSQAQQAVADTPPSEVESPPDNSSPSPENQ
jgi:hypothetical protein